MITNRTIRVDDLNFEKGEVILINKNLNLTSCAVVTKTKRIINFKKIGHAGTLDPKATGLLILCTGKETKSIPSIQSMNKEYEGKMFLGSTTPTMDTESEPEFINDISFIDESKIKETTNQFIGEIDQVPPPFSAVRINGKRAYKLARKGKSFEIKSKKIKIESFTITEFNPPVAGFKVVCSKGTYIRKLIHDFGQTLGCGAYLLELKRTKIGDFSLKDAIDINMLEKLFTNTAVN